MKTQKSLLLVVSILLTGLIPLNSSAQTPPDLSGYWLVSYGAIPPRREATALEQRMIDDFLPGTLLLSDAGLPEFPPGDFGGLTVSSAAKAYADSYDPEVQRQVSTTCLSPSVIYSMQGPFPIEIFQGTELIVIKMEYFDVVRIVFMNETEHPDDWPHSITGHSIGHWDGDALVVETSLIQASTLLNNGLEHSEDIQLTERFRVSEDGEMLLVTQEFTDPSVFEGSAARLMAMDRSDDHVYPYDCDPSYGAAIQSRDL